MRILFHIVLLSTLAATGFGQLTKIKWDIVKLPVDSLFPLALVAVDSMHLYFIADKDSSYVDSFTYIKTDKVTHYFETNNGGKTWEMRNDTAYHLFGGIQGPGHHMIYYPTIMSEGTSTRYVEKERSLYRSDDAAKSWIKTWMDSSDFELVIALTKNAPILYRNGHLYRSTDAGVTFPYIISDSTFFHTLRPDTTALSKFRGSHADIRSYVKKDVFHHTLVVNRPGKANDQDSTDYKKLFPPGLRTLVTTSGGAGWKEYNTLLPKQAFDEQVDGKLQYSCNKDRLYFISGWHTEQYSHYASDEGSSNHKMNYGYSDDDGKTWVFDTTFYRRRHAIEPVDKEEVWMSLKKDESTKSSANLPAYILTRTTDMGSTWEFDSTTLGDLFEQKADGHIITFSDPRHGWIVARIGANTYILRYDTNEQPLTVEVNKPPTYFHYMWLYPIPAKDEVQINFLKKGVMEDVEFFDVMGRKVTVPFTMTDNTATANVKDLPSGYYMVRAKLSGSYYARPLIVGK